MTGYPEIDGKVKSLLMKGLVIPAHPLALTSERQLDERRQRALTRYYAAAGAGGMAIGVHTTQFEIRDPKHRLFEPVLRLGVESINECEGKYGKKLVKVAGICGNTRQALEEAELAASLGYGLGLLSLGALSSSSTSELIEHCQKVACVIPLFGFYLQPAVGGRLLGFDFWKMFAEIENLVAIKVAPFSRYGTYDVVRGVVETGRAGEIAIYTGNDDNILADLLTTYRFEVRGETVIVRIVGGLLGQWAIWTKRAVDLLGEAHASLDSGVIPPRLLSVGAQLTDANGAIFDAHNGYAGCIPGIHEVLRRQGLLSGRWCLNPKEELSSGQLEEIDRVHTSYPSLSDDTFVSKNLEEWLS